MAGRAHATCLSYVTTSRFNKFCGQGSTRPAPIDTIPCLDVSMDSCILLPGTEGGHMFRSPVLSVVGSLAPSKYARNNGTTWYSLHRDAYGAPKSLPCLAKGEALVNLRHLTMATRLSPRARWMCWNSNLDFFPNCNSLTPSRCPGHTAASGYDPMLSAQPTQWQTSRLPMSRPRKAMLAWAKSMLSAPSWSQRATSI